MANYKKTHVNKKTKISYLESVWPEENCLMFIKVAQKWFQ